MRGFRSPLPVAIGGPFRWLTSDWNDGSDGYSWKARSLQEKRALAMEYLGDVKKRVPIHDAVRMKSELNRKSLQEAGESVSSFFEQDDSFLCEDGGAVGSSTGHIVDQIEATINQLVLDEFSGDDIAHVSESDSHLLREEFFGGDTVRAKNMKEWLKLRRDTADYLSYASIPEAERNEWSAWYLRNVRSDPERDS